MRTCKGCANNQRLMLRGQWHNICRVTGKTAPMVWCKYGKPRFGSVRVVAREMAVELL